MACMKAYTVVGPTKVQPRFFRSFDIAIDSGEVAIALQRRQRDALRPRARRRLEAPGIGRERAELRAQLEHAPRVVDRRFDLAAMAHDAGIGEQPLDVGAPKRATRSASKSAKARRKASRLLRIVSQLRPGLEAFEAQLLEQPPVVRDREAPLVVVVVPVGRAWPGTRRSARGRPRLERPAACPPSSGGGCRNRSQACGVGVVPAPGCAGRRK